MLAKKEMARLGEMEKPVLQAMHVPYVQSASEFVQTGQCL